MNEAIEKRWGNGITLILAPMVKKEGWWAGNIGCGSHTVYKLPSQHNVTAIAAIAVEELRNYGIVTTVGEILAINKLNDCVFFSFSHGYITEGCGMNLLNMDRQEFRDRWIAFLQANPEVAKSSGWENWLEQSSEATE